jgi:hypothetical protein
MNLNPLRRPDIPPAFRKYSIIYIHVPKTGGVTLSIGLFGYLVGHQLISRYFDVDRAFCVNAFKFSLVRHPVTRFVSTYHYLREGGMNSHDSALRDNHQRAFASLSSFAEAVYCKSFRSTILHLTPQSNFLSLRPGRPYDIIMDFIGKVEDFNSSVQIISQSLPQPLRQRMDRVNGVRRNGRGSLSKVTNDVLKAVNDLYAQDFENFGYKRFSEGFDIGNEDPEYYSI